MPPPLPNMLALGYVLMAISVIAVGIPIVWYVISVFRTYPDKWVKLSDDIDRDFPAGTTRLADFINPANFPDTGPTKEARKGEKPKYFTKASGGNGNLLSPCKLNAIPNPNLINQGDKN